MLDIGSWYLTMFDKPMFQFAQGIVIGVLIMGAIWLLSRAVREDKPTEEVGNISDEEEDDGQG